jgi:hypothetical protein
MYKHLGCNMIEITGARSGTYQWVKMVGNILQSMSVIKNTLS